ncbi:hypothetical protein [Pseudomonas sp. S1(2024)]|uniref:hypothetical protein n=1 Tax=Pseudomonas sp. S1(2024) TaxID=3390191 RepID=UPI00397E554B
MIGFLTTLLRWMLVWYTYVATGVFTLVLILFAWGHFSGNETLPADFANKKAGAGFSILSSNALRDVSITRSQGNPGANLRLVNVQGASITPVQTTFFLLIGSSKAPDSR